VALASDWAAGILEKKAGAPLGWIERISWSGDEVIEEVSHTWYDPEVCHYVSRMP
jgi:GntR family transcriptional regulator